MSHGRDMQISLNFVLPSAAQKDIYPGKWTFYDTALSKRTERRSQYPRNKNDHKETSVTVTALVIKTNFYFMFCASLQ